MELYLDLDKLNLGALLQFAKQGELDKVTSALVSCQTPRPVEVRGFLKELSKKATDIKKTLDVKSDKARALDSIMQAAHELSGYQKEVNSIHAFRVVVKKLNRTGLLNKKGPLANLIKGGIATDPWLKNVIAPLTQIRDTTTFDKATETTFREVASRAKTKESKIILEKMMGGVKTLFGITHTGLRYVSRFNPFSLVFIAIFFCILLLLPMSAFMFASEGSWFSAALLILATVAMGFVGYIVVCATADMRVEGTEEAPDYRVGKFISYFVSD